MPKAIATKTTTTVKIMVVVGEEVVLCLGMVLGLGMPTAIGVPVRAEAGIVPDTVSGEVNVVVTLIRRSRSSTP